MRLGMVNGGGVATGGIQFFVNQSQAMTLDGAGNVGIGTTNPTLGPLQMGSGAYVTAGGVWTNASSRALKRNIRPLGSDAALTAFLALEPVTFEYKAAANESHVGFIAGYNGGGSAVTRITINVIAPELIS